MQPKKTLFSNIKSSFETLNQESSNKTYFCNQSNLKRNQKSFLKNKNLFIKKNTLYENKNIQKETKFTMFQNIKPFL